MCWYAVNFVADFDIIMLKYVADFGAMMLVCLGAAIK